MNMHKILNDTIRKGFARIILSVLLSVTALGCSKEDSVNTVFTSRMILYGETLIDDTGTLYLPVTMEEKLKTAGKAGVTDYGTEVFYIKDEGQDYLCIPVEGGYSVYRKDGTEEASEKYGGYLLGGTEMISEVYNAYIRTAHADLMVSNALKGELADTFEGKNFDAVIEEYGDGECSFRTAESNSIVYRTVEGTMVISFKNGTCIGTQLYPVIEGTAKEAGIAIRAEIFREDDGTSVAVLYLQENGMYRLYGSDVQPFFDVIAEFGEALPGNHDELTKKYVKTMTRGAVISSVYQLKDVDADELKSRLENTEVRVHMTLNSEIPQDMNVTLKIEDVTIQ